MRFKCAELKPVVNITPGNGTSSHQQVAWQTLWALLLTGTSGGLMANPACPSSIKEGAR